MTIHPWKKMLLGFDPDTDDEIVRREWDRRTTHVCKPCWELKYCPYGPLVEEFPLTPESKVEAIERNESLKAQLEKGAYDEEQRKIVEEWVESFSAEDYPDIPQEELDRTCTVYRHLCPVFFVNRPFTETLAMRRIGAYIPAKIKMRVVRRDNYTCQICGKHLKDDEIEFDHVIPRAQGGSSEEHNIRLTCFDCNRRKSKKLQI